MKNTVYHNVMQRPQKRWPACSGVPTYAPDEPPSHWRKLDTAEGAAGQPDVMAAVQSQPLDLPLPLPDLSRVQGPVQQVWLLSLPAPV